MTEKDAQMICMGYWGFRFFFFLFVLDYLILLAHTLLLAQKKKSAGILQSQQSTTVLWLELPLTKQNQLVNVSRGATNNADHFLWVSY